jgi:membrane-bound lytic murein transglycosylase D
MQNKPERKNKFLKNCVISNLCFVFIIILSINTLAIPNKHFAPVDKKPFFNIPITYNMKVQYWIHEFQTKRRYTFKKWLHRSTRYLPKMKVVFKNKGLPEDLSYIALIESGLKARAVSHANAVGYWQFISSTGKRYGLKKEWWIDERMDYYKSTTAATQYISDLYKIFGSWYLTAAAYNMGENRLLRLIKKHKTKDFWKLSRKRDFPKETREYIPKLLATVLMAKIPKLYGFKKPKQMRKLEYEPFYAPGGTSLHNMAKFMGFSPKHFSNLNPALLKGFIPKHIKGYWLRIPKGHLANAAQFLRSKPL